MWATLSRLVSRLERALFELGIVRLPDRCGHGPRIEGLSLDRQEKCITFFRILPTRMIVVYAS